MEEREQERQRRRGIVLSGDPEQVRELESCRLARTELKRQFELTTHEVRRRQIEMALTALDRQITELSA